MTDDGDNRVKCAGCARCRSITKYRQGRRVTMLGCLVDQAWVEPDRPRRCADYVKLRQKEHHV